MEGFLWIACPFELERSFFFSYFLLLFSNHLGLGCLDYFSGVLVWWV
jgi:hypothetical protein